MFQKELTISKTSASKECDNCRYWYFKDVGFKSDRHVCNKCQYLLMIAYKLKSIAILNIKGVNFRCILRGIRRDDTVNRVNNSMLEDKDVL